MNLFSLMVGIGASLSLLQVWREAPPRKELAALLNGWLVLLAALIGGRAGFVWLNPHLFAKNWPAALHFWEGGLIFPTALLAVLLIIPLLSLVRRQPFTQVADLTVGMLIPLAVSVWLGCGAAGCAYGTALTEQYPWALPVFDADGTLTYRFPLPYLAALVLLLIARPVEKKAFALNINGARACLLGFVLALHTIIFSSWRADAVPTFQNIRLDYAVSYLLGGLSLIGVLVIEVIRLVRALNRRRLSAGRPPHLSS